MTVQIPMVKGSFLAGYSYSDTPPAGRGSNAVQVDDYSLNLVAGQTYYFSLTDGVPTSISINTPQNTPAFSATLQTGAAPTPFTPSVSGTYTLQVDDSHGYEISGGSAWATVGDLTANLTCASYMAAYSGPVSYLTNQFIYATSDTVVVVPSAGNTFVDILGDGPKRPLVAGIDVSTVGGNNILDSYANSSFLVGGSLHDEFYEDARNLSQNSWTTVVNFHAGDDLTAWGVEPADFVLEIIGDTQGAAGYTGLTGGFVPIHGGPVVGFTLAGVTMADYTTGRVTVSYGRTQSVGAAEGSTYASVHYNG